MLEPRVLEADLAPHDVASLPPAQAYLYSLARPGAKYALENVERLLSFLGDPHRTHPWFHVAGTNGKGSTASMLASMLVTTGQRVGLFTSPHLLDLRERIRIDGVPIAPDQLDIAVERLRQAIKAMRDSGVEPPSFFEALFGVAAVHFQRAGTTIAVAEVGLGGRLDATNVITPRVSIITNIGHDHRETLGATLVDIAREKAGIAKPGVPLISGASGEAAQVIQDVCASRNAPLIDAHQYRIDVRDEGPCGSTFDLAGPDLRRTPYRIPLAGAHQMENARLAILALQRSGLADVHSGLVQSGLAHTRWPGRFEMREGHPRIVLDAAHNPEAVDTLCRTVADCFPGAAPCVVFGACRDKDIASMLARLAPHASHLILTRSTHQRSADPDQLALHLPSPCAAIIHKESSPERALHRALALAGPSGLVIVTGSIFLLGDLWMDLECA